MPVKASVTGSELFIVDNSDEEWKVRKYLHDWCQLSKAIDIATGYFEIGSLLALGEEWKKVDKIRILMGAEVSKRTAKAFADAQKRVLPEVLDRLDASLEAEKATDAFLSGVPAIAEALRSGRIECRVYRKDKFHAKAYITHARMEVVGSFGLVGSSNFTAPGLSENIELNVQIAGSPVAVLQEWFERHWNDAEPATPEVLSTIERQIRDYSPFEQDANSRNDFPAARQPRNESALGSDGGRSAVRWNLLLRWNRSRQDIRRPDDDRAAHATREETPCSLRSENQGALRGRPSVIRAEPRTSVTSAQWGAGRLHLKSVRT